MESKHLSEIIRQHNRTCSLQVVLLDVERYSRRRTLNQITVIDSLTECVGEALDAVGKEHLAYAQDNDLNFKTDIITIPTGDGAAVVFSFDGLHDIHLVFAKQLLQSAWKRREQGRCEHFDQHGWCNCHAYFNLRIGVSEGKGILFRDVNGNHNAAGSVMNLASRVMSLADRNQIIFTEEAYRQIIDMISDPTFIKHFVEFKGVEIKHGEKINVYQYVGSGEAFLNAAPPEDLVLKARLEQSMERMRGLGFPMPNSDALDKLDKNTMLDLVEKFVTAASGLRSSLDVFDPPINITPSRPNPPGVTAEGEGAAETKKPK